MPSIGNTKSGDVEKPSVRFRFKKEVGEEQEQEMWSRFFDAIGLFANEGTPTSEIDHLEGKR